MIIGRKQPCPAPKMEVGGVSKDGLTSSMYHLREQRLHLTISTLVFPGSSTKKFNVQSSSHPTTNALCLSPASPQTPSPHMHWNPRFPFLRETHSSRSPYDLSSHCESSLSGLGVLYPLEGDSTERT